MIKQKVAADLPKMAPIAQLGEANKDCADNSTAEGSKETNLSLCITYMANCNLLKMVNSGLPIRSRFGVILYHLVSTNLRLCVALEHQLSGDPPERLL